MLLDDKEFRKIVLTTEDQRYYEGWEFINMKAFEEELVEYLYNEETVGYCLYCNA